MHVGELQASDFIDSQGWKGPTRSSPTILSFVEILQDIDPRSVLALPCAEMKHPSALSG